MTGYELARVLKKPVGYFWTAGHSQIYPELSRLHAARLISARSEPGPGPRENRRYTITAAGRRELVEWAAAPAALEPSRNEELLKAYSLWLVEPQRARAALEHQQERHRELLSRYEEIAAELDRDGAPDLWSPRFFDLATLRRGIIFERGVIEWFGDLLARID